MSRELVVSAGDNAPHVVRITDRQLGDLSSATWKVQLAPAAAHPLPGAAWLDPDDVTLSTGDGSTHTNVADVSMSVSSSNATPGADYRMWVLVTIGGSEWVLPDVEIVHAA